MSLFTHARWAVLFAVTLLSAPLDGHADNDPGASRPNIVFIMADDLGWSDLSVQGSRFYETPRIDALARSGMRFTNAYANAPNCAPTRASLMSGQYMPRHGIYTVNDPWRGDRAARRLVPAENTRTLALEVVTLGEALKSAGYRTAHIGKWHLGAPGEAGPLEQGFDVNVGGTHRGHPPTYFSPYGIPTLEDGPAGSYLTDRLTDEAIQFVRAHRDTSFFLYLSHFAVHTPIEAKARLAARYHAKPPWQGQSNATYAAMIESLDQNVGRLLDALELLGLSENTIVVFTSDNGGLGGYTSAGVSHSRDVTDNHPLKGGKGQLYEGGIRVPAFVRWPGVVKTSSISDVPILTMDFYMTLLEAAGAPASPGQKMDGVSLLKALRGEGAPDRESLFWYFPAYLQAYGTEGLRTSPAAAVRHGHEKLLWFFETDDVELYDLAEDLGEQQDLSADRPQRSAALRTLIEDWMDRMKALRPAPNPEFDPGKARR